MSRSSDDDDVVASSSAAAGHGTEFGKVTATATANSSTQAPSQAHQEPNTLNVPSKVSSFNVHAPEFIPASSPDSSRILSNDSDSDGQGGFISAKGRKRHDSAHEHHQNHSHINGQQQSHGSKSSNTNTGHIDDKHHHHHHVSPNHHDSHETGGEKDGKDHGHRHHINPYADDFASVREKMKSQVEFYFSDKNLPTDNFLMKLVKKDPEGFVHLKSISEFRKIKAMAPPAVASSHSAVVALLVAAIKESSELLMSDDLKKVRRLAPLPDIDLEEVQSRTVLVENLPEDHSIVAMEALFSKCGHVRLVRVCDPKAVNGAGSVAQAAGSSLAVTNKLHALVEYETLEEAEKAAAELNDTNNWRSGLRVRLLRRLGKQNHQQHGQSPNHHHHQQQNSHQNNKGVTEKDSHHDQHQHHLSQTSSQRSRSRSPLSSEGGDAKEQPQFSDASEGIEGGGHARDSHASGHREEEHEETLLENVGDDSDASGSPETVNLGVLKVEKDGDGEGSPRKKGKSKRNKGKGGKGGQGGSHKIGSSGTNHSHSEGLGQGSRSPPQHIHHHSPGDTHGHGRAGRGGTASPLGTSPLRPGSHHLEGGVMKPPPGPKMPDGTRGFVMGRGKRLTVTPGAASVPVASVASL
eukprot:TRINITY_DN1769_c0_g1_i2.p1 TRINITY_DN1769_c0_g1~~TRINITY_DN1769_c0_g1_i2.p1  ORF type:complete len:634 (-),score=166.45 TRINITY_DN1769_c0_g1_i2:152-2053(-)